MRGSADALAFLILLPFFLFPLFILSAHVDKNILAYFMTFCWLIAGYVYVIRPVILYFWRLFSRLLRD